MSKTRAYCFTLNNPTQDEEEAVLALPCIYVCYGREVGDSGTPHLQGYIHFKDGKSLASVKKMMPRAHLEARKGTVDQAVDYCKKDGDFEEVGKKPASPKEKGVTEKTRWKRINEKAFEGDEDWLLENEPAVYHKCLATFRSHKKPKTECLNYTDEDTPNEWIVGPTGCGKSKYVYDNYKGAYKKMLNKWWCNYLQQDVVHIEEPTPDSCKHLANFFKIWADRYPFAGEIKGGRIEGLRPAKIIVTSNYSIQECFPNQEDYLALERRFKITNHYK